MTFLCVIFGCMCFLQTSVCVLQTFKKFKVIICILIRQANIKTRRHSGVLKMCLLFLHVETWCSCGLMPILATSVPSLSIKVVWVRVNWSTFDSHTVFFIQAVSQLAATFHCVKVCALVS